MKILIAEPFDICRFAFRTLISECASDICISEARTILEIREYLASDQPDFIIIEPTHFLQSDDSLLLSLTHLLPNTRILIISSLADREHYLTLPCSNHFQFLLKELSVQEQKEVLYKFISTADVSKNDNFTLTPAQPATQSVLPILTQREEEILSLIATGKTAKEIGDSLFISPHTAQRHRKNILKKLGLKGTAELVRYYLENMN